MSDRHPLFESIADLDLPEDWIQAKDQIKSESGRTVVLGAPDSGKSTFALWVAEECYKEGKTVAYIDSDMGQSHVGPPATVGLELLRSDSRERESYLYFIGATNPKQHLLQTLAGVRSLLDKACQLGAEKILVDTTGLVHGGAARELKLQKINLLKPDSLVGIQRAGEVEHLLSPHRNFPGLVLHRLGTSPRATIRRQDARRNYRGQCFREYLSTAARVDFPLSKVWMQGRNFCTGQLLNHQECSYLSRILGAKMVFGQRLPEELFLVTNSTHNLALLEKARKKFGATFIFHMPIASFRNLVVGLIDKSGFTAALGLFFYINLKEKIASIYTPHREIEEIEMIQFGSLHVSPNGKELDWRSGASRS